MGWRSINTISLIVSVASLASCVSLKRIRTDIDKLEVKLNAWERECLEAMEEHRLDLKLSAVDAAILKESKLPKEIPILAPDRADYTKDLKAVTAAAHKEISMERPRDGHAKFDLIFAEKSVDRVRAAVLKVTRNDCPSLYEYAESSENVVRKDLAKVPKSDREAYRRAQSFKTDLEKVSYAIGYGHGVWFKREKIDPSFDDLQTGLKHGAAGDKSIVSVDESEELMRSRRRAVEADHVGEFKKVSYVVGYKIGGYMRDGTSVDSVMLQHGIKDALAGQKSPLKPEESRVLLGKIESELRKKEEAKRQAQQKTYQKDLKEVGVKIAKALQASGATHVIKGLALASSYMGCEAQLKDGEYVCANACIVPIKEYIETFESGGDSISCISGRSASGFVLTLHETPNQKVLYSGNWLLGVVREPDTQLQNKFGAVLPAASWSQRGSIKFAPDRPKSLAH
jgi:hypothetical protein